MLAEHLAAALQLMYVVARAHGLYLLLAFGRVDVLTSIGLLGSIMRVFLRLMLWTLHQHKCSLNKAIASNKKYFWWVGGQNPYYVAMQPTSSKGGADPPRLPATHKKIFVHIYASWQQTVHCRAVKNWCFGPKVVDFPTAHRKSPATVSAPEGQRLGCRQGPW